MLLGGTHAAAQNGPAAARKEAQAARVPPGSIRVDGRLDEQFWQSAAPVTDFVQAEPIEGTSPTDAMEVRFVYDDSALYVGARMSHSGAGPVRAAMSRRDDGNQAEYLQIELDTYLDRRTAYMFGVTASGVRLDHYHSSDNEGNFDSGFDPVWEARTEVTADGWTAELWLPFAQLRFNDDPERIWGLNIKRWRPDLNEEDYWVMIGRTERGWASRFGDLRGIEGVKPARRIELLPYIAGSSRLPGNRNLSNPFDDGKNLRQRVGADVKVGVGSNLTLEATVNPDFGQIEADPAEVNLSAFETFFGERRPFFVEGANLLQAATSNFFYSRRIGARPNGAASGDFIDYPDTTTILGAAKLTGRLPSGTSIGMLGAVTGEEFADTFERSVFSSVRVAPRAYWAVGRVQQEFGSQGSTVGVHMTGLHRSFGNRGDAIGDFLVRNAVTFAADTDVRWKDRTYEAGASVGFTFVQGREAAIERLQRSNGHLFQRPDRDQVRLDATRRSLGGLQLVSNIDKVGGRHWLWGANLMVESPEFEPSEFGRLNYAGDVQINGRLTYRETQPGRLFRSYSFQLNSSSLSYYQKDLGARVNVGGNTNVTLRNFWSTGFGVTRNLRGQDAQLTRGGPSMGTPYGWSVNANLRNSGSAVTRWNVGANYRTNENGDNAASVFGGITTRPAPAWQLSLSPEYSQDVTYRQYVTARDGGGAATYGRRYIFGFIDRSTLSMQLRFSYTFKPDLTLDVYGEPFAASGRYEGFGELAAARSRLLRVYGEQGTGLQRNPDGSFVVTDGDSSFTLSNRDFNVRSFRSNVVLRWEWRPGSTLFVVWQQDRNSADPAGERVGPRDLFGSFSAPGDNVFAVKTTWWISR